LAPAPPPSRPAASASALSQRALGLGVQRHCQGPAGKVPDALSQTESEPVQRGPSMRPGSLIGALQPPTAGDSCGGIGMFVRRGQASQQLRRSGRRKLAPIDLFADVVDQAHDASGTSTEARTVPRLFMSNSRPVRHISESARDYKRRGRIANSGGRWRPWPSRRLRPSSNSRCTIHGSRGALKS
jgi:hypothetical protein